VGSFPANTGRLRASRPGPAPRRTGRPSTPGKDDPGFSHFLHFYMAANRGSLVRIKGVIRGWGEGLGSITEEGPEAPRLLLSLLGGHAETRSQHEPRLQKPEQDHNQNDSGDDLNNGGLPTFGVEVGFEFTLAPVQFRVGYHDGTPVFEQRPKLANLTPEITHILFGCQLLRCRDRLRWEGMSP